MKKIRRAIPFICLFLWDLLSSVLALILAVLLRYPNSNNIPPSTIYVMPVYIPVFFCILFVVSLLLGCYNSILKHISLRDAVMQFIAVVISVTAMYMLDYFGIISALVNSDFSGFSFELSVYTISAAILYLLTVFGRSFIRIILAVRARIVGMGDSDVRRVLIFGAGEAGVFLHAKMENHPDDKLKPVVFIDDNESLIRRRIDGLLVYGGIDKMGEAIEKYKADMVVVAIPTATHELLQDAVQICREHHCQIQRFGTIDSVDLNKTALTNINYEDLLHRKKITLDMQAVNRFIKDKTVLVTGGAGSIGSEICRQVMRFGCKKLIVFDINENGLFFINNELLDKYDSTRFEMRLGSIRDVGRLNEVMDEFHPQVVFHAAAHKHVPMSETNPREAVKNNVFGTYKTAEVAGQHGVEKFILISTDKAVNPTNIMGATKRIAELVIRTLNDKYDTEYAAVRFGNVLGSNGSVVPFFQKQINHGGPVTVTHPEMRRYFMTIPEACQLVLEAGAMAAGSEVFVLDMGKPVKIYDLACDLIRLSGMEPNIDIKIKFTGLRPGEKMFEELSVDGESFIKTPNAKIFVLKPDDSDRIGFTDNLDILYKAVDDKPSIELYRIVKRIVPTFNHKLVE